MQVVVPYRPGMLFARTYDAAKAWEGGCRFVKLRNVDEKSDPEHHNPTYPELLADIWEQGEDVILLEHDVVPYEQSITEIAYCREPWCGYSYPGGPMTKISCNLGCTKISTEFWRLPPPSARRSAGNDDGMSATLGWPVGPTPIRGFARIGIIRTSSIAKRAGASVMPSVMSSSTSMSTESRE